jgi:hypothetical protein
MQSLVECALLLYVNRRSFSVLGGRWEMGDARSGQLMVVVENDAAEMIVKVALREMEAQRNARRKCKRQCRPSSRADAVTIQDSSLVATRRPSGAGLPKSQKPASSVARPGQANAPRAPASSC